MDTPKLEELSVSAYQVGGDFISVPKAERTTIGSSSTSAFGSLDPNLIKIVSGRIIAADENAIYELDAAGAKASSSLDYSLPLPSSEWVSVTAGASGIFAAANTDNTSDSGD